jgi:hypothetical protein
MDRVCLLILDRRLRDWFEIVIAILSSCCLLHVDVHVPFTNQTYNQEVTSYQ